MVLPETKPAISGSPESLLSGIASGNKSAEEELVRHYWRALYLMLFRDCHDHSMASDMAQEALCVCLVKARAGEIREAKALTSFVHRTATNLLIAHKRKEKRQKTEFTDDVFVYGDAYAQSFNKVEISVVGSTLTFTVAGIGSTSLTLS